MKYIMKYFTVFFILTACSKSIYPQVPLSNFMAAVGVLGTTDFVTNTNYLEPPTQSSLGEPFCVVIDPATGKLFVADRDNRRVLRFSSASKMINGSVAEAVFGQPDFVSRGRNTGGLSAASMNDPNSVCLDANGTLWVADMTNNRVLRFDNASNKASLSSADGVLGQPDFVTNTAGTTAGKLNGPASVFVDGSGRLWVADKTNNRVLRFDNASAKANGSNADGVLGQVNFTTGTTGLTASTMNTPWGVYVDVAGRLWVADKNNSRVIRFDNAAGLTNGSVANGVLGQPDFITNTFDVSQSNMAGPRGVYVDGLGRLFVGDEGNSRVIVYSNAATKTNGANADYVLGQPDFITSTGSQTTATSLNYPSTVFIENANNRIWIPDTYSHRILRYDVIVTPLKLGLTALIEGFYNGATMISDTVTVELRNNITPYSPVESEKIFLNTLGSGTGNFPSALYGTPYYIVVKHRNAVETWSATPQTFTSGTLSFNFTSAQSQAYGSNMKLNGSNWCLYSGDVNHDGIVDSGDLGVVDNDNANYVSGYVNTDVNGDGIVDSGDLGLTDNNNANYIGKIVPAGAPSAIRVKGTVKINQQQ